MSLPVITTKDHDFIAEGKVWKYIGVDGFALPARDFMTNGRDALTKPFFDEWDSIKSIAGFNHPLVVRAFVCAAPPNPFALNPHLYPDFYQMIGSLADYADSRGYYLDLTGGDYQYVIPSPNGPLGQQQHINELCFMAAGKTNLFIQASNEPFQNGMDVTQIVPPKWGSYLRSSGAYGDTQSKFNPVLDFIDFHPDRNRGTTYWPKFLYDLPTSAAFIMGDNNVPQIFGEPMGFDEVDSNNRSSSPLFASVMGRMASWCAGVTFHSTDGIYCNGLRPITKQCAIEFLLGAKACL